MYHSKGIDMHKQMRVSFSGVGEKEKEGNNSNRDRQIASQKTQTFKETKRTVGWLERQFTRKTIHDYDSSIGIDYPIAVAAAAFAVKSIEDKSNNDQRRTSTGAENPLNKIKYKTDDTTRRTEKSNRAAKTSKSSSKVADQNVLIRTATVNQEPINSVPPLKKSAISADIKKSSTVADKNIDITTPKTPEIKVPKLVLPPIRQSTSPSEMAKGPTTTKPGINGNSKADTWEKEEMKKINERYEKLNKVILDWETKKKKKAKRQLKKIEADLDKQRAKTRESFRADIGRIDSIAGGAKEQAEKNRENEELKVKEKANKTDQLGKCHQHVYAIKQGLLQESCK